jgi:hypothetical protein
MRLVLDRGGPQQERHKSALGSLTDCGTEVGVVPSYAGAIESEILPLQVSFLSDTTRRVSAVTRQSWYMIDWLAEAFNREKFPWLRDEFIHPSETKAV